MKKLSMIAIAGAMGIFVASLTWAQQDIAALVERVGPSVVTIKTFNSSGRPISQGSGFFLEDGRIVTNTHVVQGAANVEILDSTGQLIGITQYAEVVSNTSDLAILPRLETGIAGITGLTLAGSEPPVGTRIIVIGAPEGFQNTVSDGLVNAVRDIDSQRLLQISAPISQGSSGGPVVDMNGDVIGVSVMSFRDGQNINFAVPARSVAVLASSPPGRSPFANMSATGVPGTPSRGALIKAGETTEGALHDGLPQLNDASYFEAWYFEGRESERYRIRMTSDAFDTFLILGRIVDGRFIELVRGDDGPLLMSKDARINFTLPADGEYVIYANSYRPLTTGAYRLTLERR